MDRTDAQRNWDQIRTFLCERIGCQRTALARLAADRQGDEPSVDPTMIDNATDLIALLQTTEREMDRAFAQQSMRPVDTAPRHEPRPADSREFQSR
ncbi:MAG: hypothetical protein GF341_02115 [candidate division Zixibacteria bacterium]|nr:hypothetical protein [candidate division Zixibacteria bacterium]